VFRCDKVYYRIPDLLLPAYTSLSWTITCQHPVQAGTAVSHVRWGLKQFIARLYLISKEKSYRGDIHTTISIILLKHATFHTKCKRLKYLSHASNWLISTPNWSTQWIQQSRFHNLCILKTEVEPPSIMLRVLTIWRLTATIWVIPHI